MDDSTFQALVISSAIGGAAGSFVKELTHNGAKWLMDVARAHSPAMQENARRNVENFVTRLAQRVERLEKEIPAGCAKAFEDSLSDPGSALLIKNALTDAATTSNDDKHKLLAELVAQRLTSGPEDMISLAGAAACDVIVRLTSRQIRCLAVISTAYAVRPLQSPVFRNEIESKEYTLKWWDENLSPLINEDFSKSSKLDFDHLVAMGCIQFSIASTSLRDLMVKGMSTPNTILSEEELLKIPWFSMISGGARNLVEHSTPNTTGLLIGVLHRDATIGTNTKIAW